MTAEIASQLARDFQQRLVALQKAERLPATAAAIGKDGALLYVGGVGDPPPTPDTQFRIGSISKTFTAVLIMQLRDEGRLRLDDRLDQFVGSTVAGHVTIRQLLSHTAGLSQEPVGPFWEATGRTHEELLGGLREEDLVLKPGRTYHYSNVGFALLGQVVEQVRGQAWKDALRERILEPLGLTRTSYAPTAPFAQGWRVHPFANTLQREPHADTGAMAPAGQIWSTPCDLVRWGTFLADPDPAVLHPDTVDEMATPVVMVDAQGWTTAYGLGLDMIRHDDHIVVGHGGSMPGFSARLSVARREKVASAIVTNAWGGRQGTFVHDAIETVLSKSNRQTVWQVENVPDEIGPLLGTWWYRGLPFVVSYREGALYLGQPNEAQPATRFDPAGSDSYRCSAGRMHGETMRVMRDGAGVPVVLEINTWLLVRTHDDPLGGP